MKAAMKVLAYAVAVLIGLQALLFAASEYGEVVVLTTFDETDAPHTTRLWIVEYKGDTYLRAGSTDSSWFQRIQQNPLVTIHRDNEDIHAHLTPSEPATPEINALMARKYGLADTIVGAMFSRDEAVALRIDPVAHP